MNFPRIVLAGTQSGVGKTTLSIGIMAALKKRGLNIQPYKVGPDYIDPAFHTFVTKNRSRNLDSWMLGEEEIIEIFSKNAVDKDVSIVEGVMGLYDGSGSNKDQGSTAHLSKIIHAPVILVINGKGMSCSAAAQVLGYKLYDLDVNIKGVIINNISGEAHYQLLKEAIERDVKVRCLGYMKQNPHIQLKSRHLGLIPSVEVEDLKKKIEEIGDMVEETVDLDELLKISRDVPLIDYKPKVITPLGDVRIGVARDQAFNFYYEDNLDLLEDLGAKLVFFSPMSDLQLPPNLDGLYFGGGFPEVFGEELEHNISMREDIRRTIEAGIPTYAECGGFMYLTNRITELDEKSFEMVGIFNREAKMTNRLQRFGYVHVNIDNPCVIAKDKISFKAHEFHRSEIEDGDEENIYRVEKIRNGEVIKKWQCGLKKYNALGAYAHIHFYSNKKVAYDFLENCMAYKDRNGEEYEK